MQMLGTHFVAMVFTKYLHEQSISYRNKLDVVRDVANTPDGT